MTRRKDPDLLVKLTDGPIVSRVTLSQQACENLFLGHETEKRL